ncbi:MAG: hypothetical protein IJ743_04495 [Bacilli bacterium]|nr:hypothetical protein [Bacilli bacterium]
MSTSKFIMAKKLQKVQDNLRECKIEGPSLESLIPLIFEKCYEEKLTFWFNVFENEIVLNLRDVEQENYELNFRQHYKSTSTLDEFKVQLLFNVFLLWKNTNKSSVASSAKKESSKTEQVIITGDKPTPPHIREAIKKIEAKGIPVTVEAIQNHLPLGQMSTSHRMECNKYLKKMMEAFE